MNTAEENARYAVTVVRALAASGLREVVASPGSRHTPLLLAFAEHPGVEVRVVLDERVAAFVALGLARVLGRPAALLCTSGSAVGHYMPAVIEAAMSRVPLVLISADRPPELHDCGAPQTIDQQRLFGKHALEFVHLGPPEPAESAEYLIRVVARMYDVALSRGGPVHLNVAFRKPLWAPGPPPSPEGRPVPHVLRGAARLDDAQVRELARTLASEPRGLIVCGPRASGRPPGHAPAFARSVTSLAARLGWPIIADPASGLRFGAGDAALVISTADALVRDESFASGHVPGRVLRLGQIPTSQLVGDFLARAPAVLVDPYGDWHDPDEAAELICAADPTALCQSVLRELEAASVARNEDWLADWRRAERTARGVLDDATGEGPVWEGAVARTVVESLPAGALLHVANSMPVRDLDSFAPPLDRRITVLTNQGANGIDGTLSTAWGEALAWRGGPLAVLIGDLAFLHDVGGLLAARALGVEGSVVVVNNGGGGIFSFLPIARHETAFEPLFLTRQEADIGGLCAAAGVAWERVDSLARLRGALTTSLSGLRVLEVPVDRELNLARHEAAWSAVSRALEEKRVGRLERGREGLPGHRVP